MATVLKRPLRSVLAAVFSITLASCVSAPGPAAATGYTRTYDVALLSDPAAYNAWVAYCDFMQRDMEQFYMARPEGRYEASFEAEYAARESMTEVYARQHAAGGPETAPTDSYLGELLAIRSSGYLKQYVFFEHNPGNWEKPVDLEEGGYFAWMRARYPNHAPRTSGIVRRTTGLALVHEVEMVQWSVLERRMVELSFISMAGFWLTDAAKVAEMVSGLLTRMLPRQEIVWGPSVHQPSAGGLGISAQPSDALVFICRDIDTGEYSVVFRGTNPISSTEWLLQDFMIQKQVPWRQIQAGSAPEDARVSEGTATAITLRCALRPVEGAKGRGLSLAEAFVDILEHSEGRSVVHFTGHSLGGLLAPTMALWLVDYLTATGREDLLSKLDLDAYSFAAPTAGNRSFCAYIESRMDGYVRYVNDLDIATRVWDEAALEGLPSLYAPEIGMQPITRSMYDICAALARDKGYAQPGARVVVPSEVVPVRGGLYLLEAIYQHSVPYLDMLLPARKESIIREVYEPLLGLISVKGLTPIDIGGLFDAASH